MNWRRTLLIVALLTPGLGVIVLMIGWVTYVAIMQSFGFYSLTEEGSFSVEHWQKVLDSKSFPRALKYSAYIAVVSAIGSLVVAYPLAIWLRRPFKGSLAIGAVLKAPLFVPGLVASFLFLNMINYHGIVNQALMWVGFTDEPIRLQNDRGAWGVVFLQIWKNMPFALLLLTGSVQAISDEVLDAARDLGAGTFARFRKVIAPLTVSAMQASLIIIFIGAAGDFAFQVTAGPTNVQSMAQYMVFLKDSFGRWHQAAAVGVSLMGLALVGSFLLAGAARLLLRTSKW